MNLLLSIARRRAAPKWICHSCLGVRHASQSLASSLLRERGPARTRFAPSPTGYLHLGSLRTALFNYLVAKATGGQFLLRIEDTDQKRTIPDAEERLYEDLEWAGIHWDEGPKIGGAYGPYNQSQRTAIYREHAEKLLLSDHAYRCFCSQGRLRQLAKHNAELGLPPDYDRTCFNISKEESDDRTSKGEPHVIRLRVPERYPDYHDEVYGRVNSNRSWAPKRKLIKPYFDDPILLKTDGYPTYHLANVVDDHLMKITDVIRGTEWMSSTPKHLELYRAFGWQPPRFAHVGLLLDANGQKLSKRNGDIVDVRHYRKKGIFPETLDNFVALLGWSHRSGNDVMGMENLIQNASMKYTKGETIVTFQKLEFLQRRHAMRYASMPLNSNPLKELAVKPIVTSLDIRCAEENFAVYTSHPKGQPREDYIMSILLADAQNYQAPQDFIERNIYFLVAPSTNQLLSNSPTMKLRKVPTGIDYQISLDNLVIFNSLIELSHEEWKLPNIKARIELIAKQATVATCTRSGVELQETGIEMLKKSWTTWIHQYLRWALNGSKSGPESGAMMVILGREECIARLTLATSVMETSQMKTYQKMEDVKEITSENV